MKRITMLFALLLMANSVGCGASGGTTPVEGTTEAVTEYRGEYAKLAKTDLRYSWIHAFLTGDSDSCAAIANADPEAYSFIEDLTLTYYRVTDIDSYNTEFTFTVKGGKDILPDGEYTHMICSGVYLFENSTPSNPDDAIPLSVSVMLPFCSDVLSLDDFSGNDDEVLVHGMFLALLRNYADANGGITYIPESELFRGGSLVFGTHEFPISDKVAVYENGVYSSVLVGGTGIMYRVESYEASEEKTEYVIQYYHDTMYLVKSHLIKIVTEETGDSVFGTRIISIERIEEGQYDPFAYAV